LIREAVAAAIRYCPTFHLKKYSLYITSPYIYINRDEIGEISILSGTAVSPMVPNLTAAVLRAEVAADRNVC
jgi:hypothetical protein